MRRLNVKLTLWLLGIVIFSVVGVHFLHGYQVDRNAEILKVQAEQAAQAGNTEVAINQYKQYLRHRNDRDGYKAYSDLAVKVAQDSTATAQQRLRAYGILEEAIRRHPDLSEVRRSLVDFTMMVRRFADTQDHIGWLKDNGATDPELDLKSAVAHILDGEEETGRKQLYTLVGYDPLAGEFAATPPPTATLVDAYLTLAQLLRRNNEDAKEADAVMAQLVAWNPGSSRAHQIRGQYLLTTWQQMPNDLPDFRERKTQTFAEAKAELEKSIELDAKNPDAVLALATVFLLERQFDRAQELLDAALQDHPERHDVYLRRTGLALAQGDPKKACEELEQGLAKAKDKRLILEQLAEIRFQMQDIAGVRTAVAEMEKVPAIPPEQVRFQKARLMLAEGKVLEAARELEQVEPALERLNPQSAQQVNGLLARCYEMLGLPDRQLEVCRTLLGSQPGLTMARIGMASALQTLGRHAEAETSVSLLATASPQLPQFQGAILQLCINQLLNKPKDERNWEPVEKIAEMMFQDKSRTSLQNHLLRSQLLVLQDRNDEAREILTALRKEHPKEEAVWLALSKLMASDEKTRNLVPQLLVLAEKELGDTAALHGERIGAVTRARGENVLEELKALEKGIEKYNEAQQQGLLYQLGFAYLGVGSYEDGKRCWNVVLGKAPMNTRLRLMLFDLALEKKDEPAIQAALAQLRDSRSFGVESPLYKYCTAAYAVQKINAARRERRDIPLTEDDLKTIAEVRREVDEAIAARGEWAPLWRLRGELDQLERNIDGAIANYQQSLDYSRVSQEATARRLITLLYATRRYAEANEAIKYLSTDDLPDELRQLIGDTKIKSGNAADALAMAKADVEKQPDNPSSLIWYGQLLNNAGRTDEAEAVLRKATQVGPKLPATWELLVRRLMGSHKKEEAVAAVAEAAKSLSDDTLFMAGLYEIIGDNKQAEALFASALAAKPDDLTILRRMVVFSFNSDQPERALKLLDEIVAKGSKSTEKGAEEQVRWARIAKAAQLSRAGGYNNVMNAVKLIEQNAKNGQLSQADMVAIIELLHDRPEYSSRAKAIEMLEKVQQNFGLSPRQMVALAILYHRANRWSDARELMLNSLNNQGDNAETYNILAAMLLDHKEASEATPFVEKAEELIAAKPNNYSESVKQATRMLRARLLLMNDKRDEAVASVEAVLKRPLPQNQLPLLAMVASQLESLKLYDASRRLLDEYASQEPRGMLALAAFVGRRGDVAHAFSLLEEYYKLQPNSIVLPPALQALRLYPKEITPERCKLLEQWAKTAIEADKDANRNKLMLAELYDLQGRYDDVLRLYREILSDPKAPTEDKAVTENNLAFVLVAVNPTPERGAEALQLTQKSINTLGPNADLLDTRALAYLAQGKAKQAAEDLNVAILDAPSTAKYYHLAKVEKSLGNVEAAREAMTKAQELRGPTNSFTPAELKEYEQLQQELN